MIGLDLLGLGSRHWPIDVTVKIFPDNWAVGCFLDTFGDVRPNLKKLLNSNKVLACRIHLWWSDSHKIAPLSVVRDGAKEVERLSELYPRVHFLVSHSCEYSERDRKAIEQRVELVREYAPSCEVVSAAMNSWAPPFTTIEKHGDVKVGVGQIVSTDGVEIADIDAANYASVNDPATITFLWSHRFNLRHAGANPPPKQRTAAPDRKYLADVIALAQEKGAPPPSIFPKAKPVKKPLLWKTFAEDKGGSDSRANLPLLICPSKAKQIVIRGATGAHIATLGYFGKFEGNLNRFYSGYRGGTGLSSSQIAKKATAQTGSPWVWFDDGVTVWGPVHPAFRCGYFR